MARPKRSVVSYKSSRTRFTKKKSRRKSGADNSNDESQASASITTAAINYVEDEICEQDRQLNNAQLRLSIGNYFMVFVVHKL